MLPNQNHLFVIAISFKVVDRGVVPLDSYLFDLTVWQFMILLMKVFTL